MGIWRCGTGPSAGRRTPHTHVEARVPDLNLARGDLKIRDSETGERDSRRGELTHVEGALDRRRVERALGVQVQLSHASQRVKIRDQWPEQAHGNVRRIHADYDLAFRQGLTPRGPALGEHHAARRRQHAFVSRDR